MNIDLPVSPEVCPFDGLARPHKARVQIRHALIDDLPELKALAGRHLSDELAPVDVVGRVITHNPNNLMVMCQGERLVGLWAMLMLNARGLEALLTGGIKAHDPDLTLLSASTEAPAAIYVWVIICPGTAAEGIHHMSHFLRQPLYRNANLYSRPTTDAGVRINLRRGLVPLGTSNLGLFRYVREANKPSHLQFAA